MAKSSPKIIDLLQQRLDLGKAKYNLELPSDDGRDWTQETLEELLDAIIYLANFMLVIKERDKLD